MNKPLSPAELQQLGVPVQTLFGPTVITMTRNDKLRHLAELIRHSGFEHFHLFHDLEHYSMYELRRASHPKSVFALAASDGQFKQAGLKGDSAADAMKFFELSQDELHEFSCDCGGAIDNKTMARRVENLIGPKPSLFERLKSAVGG